MKKERQSFGVIKYGELYRSTVTKMPTGYGIISWDSFNCLNPRETVVWLKICESASKIRDGWKITISEPWLNRNFKDRTEWRWVISTIFDLEEIGYIDCKVYKASIIITINYENIQKIIYIIGRERGAGTRVASLSKDIFSLSHEDIDRAKMPVQYEEYGNHKIQSILDDLCERD